MCDPVSATALAMSMAGTYMQTRESNKNAQRVQDAKNNAFASGMTRQHQYADESGQAFNQNVETQGRDAFDQQAAKEDTRMKEAFTRVRSDDPNYTAVPQSTPQNVITAASDANAKADAKTNRDLEGMSSLNSYGGAAFNQSLDRSKFSRLFGNMQDKASRDMSLIPLDMQSAGNNAQRGQSLFPQLLKYGGMAMGLYGAANGINSFGDKVFQGPMQDGSVIPMQQGLWSNLKSIPNKAFGGGLY